MAEFSLFSRSQIQIHLVLLIINLTNLTVKRAWNRFYFSRIFRSWVLSIGFRSFTRICQCLRNLLIVAWLTIKSVFFISCEWHFLIWQISIANAAFKTVWMKNESNRANNFSFDFFAAHFAIHIFAIYILKKQDWFVRKT